MTWRNPRFAYDHALRDVGVSAITPNATFTAGDEKYLIDDRPSVPFAWSDSAAHYIDIDLGALTGYDRIWVPSHNVTSDWYLYQDTTSGFTSPTTLASGNMTSGIDLDSECTASSEQYIRFLMSTAGTWQIGQLVLSKTITLTAGPEPGWRDDLVPNVLTLDNGDSIQLDSDQRSLEFRWPVLGHAAATDLTKMEALIAAVSTYRPLLVDPPYDTESVILMKLQDARKQVNTLVPNGGTRTADLRISLLEYLG